MKKNETDLSRYDWTKAKRGRHLERARRSLAPVLLDPELVAQIATLREEARRLSGRCVIPHRGFARREREEKRKRHA